MRSTEKENFCEDCQHQITFPDEYYKKQCGKDPKGSYFAGQQTQRWNPCFITREYKHNHSPICPDFEKK